MAARWRLNDGNLNAGNSDFLASNTHSEVLVCCFQLVCRESSRTRACFRVLIRGVWPARETTCANSDTWLKQDSSTTDRDQGVGRAELSAFQTMQLRKQLNNTLVVVITSLFTLNIMSPVEGLHVRADGGRPVHLLQGTRCSDKAAPSALSCSLTTRPPFRHLFPQNTCFFGVSRLISSCLFMAAT